MSGFERLGREVAAIHQHAITQPQATAAMSIAPIVVQMADVTALRSAAMDSIKQTRKVGSDPVARAWAALSAAQKELREGTKETRKGIAELRKAYDRAVVESEAGRTASAYADQMKTLRSRLRQAVQDDTTRQVLRPFVQGD